MPAQSDFDERRYGDAWAAKYDEVFSSLDPAAVDFLAGFAGSGGRVLELAVGTGRIAIPLAQRGLDITGLDISQAMIDKLSSKADGATITSVVGDMVEVPVQGTFELVFVAFNSIFAISTQDRQVECFHNVAQHLSEDGCFVLECFVPDLQRYDENHRYVSESEFDDKGTEHYEVSVLDPVEQRIDTQFIWKHRDGEVSMLPVGIRFAWPAELDLMAQLAGLHLEERYAWYDRSRFDAKSERHVSVYRRS